METIVKTFVLMLLDGAIIYWLTRHVSPQRFRTDKLWFVLAAGLFWGALATLLVWTYWENYYSYFAGEWTRWV